MKILSDIDARLVMGHLLSAAGPATFEEIEGKPDRHRLTLRIKEPDGHFVVTLSAGSIRQMSEYILGFTSMH
jgi:hypothetical protein